MSPQGRAALAYARRGHAVFPVRAGGKQPLLPGRHRDERPGADQCRGKCQRDGHGCWDGTVDLDRVRAWWSRWPDANIGIRTGELFDALDLDGATGIASMEAFAAEHGFTLGEPVAPTPGGGRHHFFEPTGLGNAAGLLEGVDWRGKGGYVVVGPSIHPNGKQYAVVPAGADRPPFVPAALRARLEPAKPEPVRPRPTFQPATTRSAYARAAVENTYRRILVSAPKTRNSTAFREGAALFELVAGGVVSEAEATEAISTALAQLGKRPREIAATLASARRHGYARPRGMPATPATVALPAPGAVLTEDSVNAWTNGKPQVAPTGHSLPEIVFPTARLREVYRMLDFRSYLDGQGRRVCAGVSNKALMRAFSVSEKTVRRNLHELEGLGFITCEPSPNSRLQGGEIVRTGPNRYVLRLDTRAVQFATINRLTDRSRSQTNIQVAPTGHDHPMTGVNQVKAVTTGTTVGGEGSLQPVGGGVAAAEVEPEPAPAREPWPTDEAGNHLPVRLHVPEAGQLDHGPTTTEILTTLRSGLGEARLLGAVRHDDPDAAAKLATIHAASVPLPDGWSWRTRWHAEPVGPCVRCAEPANTTGPDGRPWHADCWSAAGTPAPRPTYQAGARLRPRVLDLAGTLGDFHAAVDRLDRDSCLDGPCRPGQPCRRHTRRQRAEP